MTIIAVCNVDLWLSLSLLHILVHWCGFPFWELFFVYFGQSWRCSAFLFLLPQNTQHAQRSFPFNWPHVHLSSNSRSVWSTPSANYFQISFSNWFLTFPSQLSTNIQPEFVWVVVRRLVKRKHVAWWSATYLVHGTYGLSLSRAALAVSLIAWQWKKTCSGLK